MEHLTLFSVPQKTELKTKTKTDSKHSEEIKKAKAIPWPTNYFICNSVNDLGRVAREIASAQEFAFDCETDSLYWPSGKLLCISIWVNGAAYLINFKHLLIPTFTYAQVAKILGQYFEQDDYRKYGFNICFDAHFIERHLDIKCGYLHFDGYVASWFQDTDLPKGQRGLKALAERYLNDHGRSYEALFGKTNWAYTDPKVGAYYACHDAELHYRVCKFFEQELEKYQPHKKLFFDLDMPILNMDFQTEREGFLLDVDYMVNKVAPDLDSQLKDLTEKMRELGLPKNVDHNSVPQLAKFLYDDLRLPRINGNSTTKSTLEKLASHHAIIEPLLEYKPIYKLKTAFVDPLSELLVNGRVYPNFRSVGTSTGRGAMDNPNMQQMPAKIGPLIRQAFIAPPGYMFVSKDLKGQELRILAHYCGGGKFGEIACAGTIYEECAATFYNVAASELKKGDERRDNGKKAWLALQYGAQANKIAEIFKVDKRKAQDFIDNLFNKRFPEIGVYQSSAAKFSKANNYIVDLLGRKRHLDYDSCETTLAKFALERAAQNHPIQGTAAEQLKLAFLLCNRWLIEKEYKTRAVLRIHDEIIFQVWIPEWTPEFEKMIDEIIINALPMCVPFETTTEIYPVKEDGYSRWGIS